MKDFTEKWYYNAIIYHIYPRSFKDSTNDGIGDIKGIIEKLDYLNDGTSNSLGVDAIWLSPVYKSPQEDFGYDVSDYYNIDPIFGDMDTFDNLIDEAHKRDIKIIKDIVPNHTSSEHPWFKESRSSKDNPKRDWYIWKDPKEDGSPPNNWLSIFGGPAWTYDEKTGQYYAHTYLKDQPDLNWHNPKVRNEIKKIMRFWLDRGIDGFRVDATYSLFKDQKFRDDPPNPDYKPGKDEPYHSLIHIHSKGRSELLDTINNLCDVVDEYEDKFIVSEAYLNVDQMVELYGSCPGNHYAPLNFNLIGMPWDAEAYKDFIDDFEENLDDESIPTYVLGNHDRSRVATRLGPEKARLAALLSLTLRGMPFIYYGDEIGMEDADIPDTEGLDPWGRNVPGFGVGRDPVRTPMQWDASEYAGFSDYKPWLPVNDNHKKVNVESEKKDSKSMLNFYKNIIHFRKESKPLRFGSYHPLSLRCDKSIFSFLRVYENEVLLIVVNFSDERKNVSYDKKNVQGLNLKEGKIIYNAKCDINNKEVDLDKFSLRPNDGYIIKLRK